MALLSQPPSFHQVRSNLMGLGAGIGAGFMADARTKWSNELALAEIKNAAAYHKERLAKERAATELLIAQRKNLVKDPDGTGGGGTGDKGKLPAYLNRPVDLPGYSYGQSEHLPEYMRPPIPPMAPPPGTLPPQLMPGSDTMYPPMMQPDLADVVEEMRRESLANIIRASQNTPPLPKPKAAKKEKYPDMTSAEQLFENLRRQARSDLSRAAGGTEFRDAMRYYVPTRRIYDYFRPQR